MYDHIGLRVGDLAASVRFYSAILAPLGFVLCSRDDSGAGSGCTCTSDPSEQVRMSRSAPGIMRQSPSSTPKASRPAAVTMAAQALERITARPITRRS
mgnify:CR=1 FL=1